MMNDKPESPEDFNAENQPENNSQNNEFSRDNSEETNLEHENQGDLQNSTPPIQQAQPTTPAVEAKKKNPYKIAFFSLGGVILLGGISFFGYKFYKESQTAEPIVENTCLDSDTKIYDSYKDAVVMVKHQYGFFARIKGKEVQLNVPEASNQTLTGTAFFIDRKGNMISNSHVLQPWTSTENIERVESEAANIRRKIASILTTDISPEGYETFIAANWGNASSEYYEEGGDDGYEGDSEENAGEEFISSAEATVVDTVAEPVDLAASIPQKDYVSEDDIQVYMKTVDISVALHNSSDEWLPCTVEKVSEESAIDLGILQLTSKETPNTVVNVVNLDNAVVDDKSLRPGEKAVMIGYPLGEDLAQTISGVKVQLYNGQISKESDGTKIQYSVTSTHGASGSPIFNHCGQLIAVNFSGIDTVQGFNFGIVTKQIQSVFPFMAEKAEVKN
ncbi:serine protease [Chryseobacterium sp.]|uniref:S1 family peptidase n=1 Tax=Chryseobacterium sp. TaxID=1871047 RepID=UPI00289B5B42|nr:serine protease [Chryseobacterium sp.]